MLNKGDEQTQQVGQGAFAIQAAGNVVVKNGLSYSEVRSVVLDVFRANFLELAGEAKEAARQRAEEITDKFLEKLQKEYPAGLSQAPTPDFQYGLFSVQRDFARAADVQLGDLLVNLLVDRTKHASRDIMQIVLNECLMIAPKLTNDQLAALSIVFFLRYCSTTGVLSFQQLAGQLTQFVRPFIDTLPRGVASYQHLEFTGCGTVQITSISLEDIFWNKYQGLFDKGIDAAELSGATFYFNRNQHLTGPCVLDSSKIQVRAQNAEHLEDLIRMHRVSAVDSQRLRQAFGKNRLGPTEIRAKLVEQVPFMQKLFDLWMTTPLNNITLTSVGIGLAHANIKRLTGDFADLAIWVN